MLPANDEYTIDNKAGGLSDHYHARVTKFMNEHTGIQLPEAKRYLIEGRLRKCQRRLGFASLSDYLDYVFDASGGTLEQVNLIDALTTNKTDFYRELEHFKWLESIYIPELVRSKKIGWSEPLRVWSAGCSSGEEPYTISIVLNEVKANHPDFRFEILATDISQSSLDTARRGIYAHDRINPVPRVLRQKYFLRSANKKDNLVKMSHTLKRPITFEEYNLITGDFRFKQSFHLIFCRNVMIYFSKPDREKLIHRFIKVMAKEGIFFSGHSERIGDEVDAFKQMIPTVYRKHYG